MSWSAADIKIVLDGDGTSDPVMTARVFTPLGDLLVMAEPRREGRSLKLDGLHLHGDGGPNRFGLIGLR